MALTGEVSVLSTSRSTCKLRRANSQGGMWQAPVSKVGSPGLSGALERMLLCPWFLPKLPHHQDARTIPRPSAISGHLSLCCSYCWFFVFCFCPSVYTMENNWVFYMLSSDQGSDSEPLLSYCLKANLKGKLLSISACFYLSSHVSCY